ncbi:MAG: tRNA (adenosine(37)-N6)-threonylcarbamoyltransferase complex dimerization subunit type 1 TsaB [Desulfobacterales bacterium]
MRILALDTSTRSCSVALLADTELLVETAVRLPETHSAHLLALVEHAMRLAGWRPADLDGVGVCVGPGSFTGLRIGIATAKGMAFAAGIPCVGVGSLEALAASLLPRDERICCLIDARRGELYCALYRAEGERLGRLAPERALTIDALLGELEGPHLFIGDGAALHADKIRLALGEGARFAPPGQNDPRAAVIGRLAAARMALDAGERGSRLVPRYLRPSDAERAALAPRTPGGEGAETPPQAIDKDPRLS